MPAACGLLGRWFSISTLVLLTVVVGYALVTHGGDELPKSSLSLFALGLAASLIALNTQTFAWEANPALLASAGPGSPACNLVG